MAGNDQNVNVKLALAGIMSTLMIIAAIIILAHACGPGPTKTVVTPPGPENPPSTDAACADGSAPGSTRLVDCPAGQTGQDEQVCAAGQWLDAVNTCKGATGPNDTCVAFAAVAPVFDQFCKTCHAVTDAAAVAAIAPAGGLAEVSRRVGLPPTDNAHMPEQDSPQPSTGQVAAIQAWVASGGKQTCPVPGPTPGAGPIRSADWIKTAVADVLTLNPTDQPFIRYMITAGAINQGLTGDALQAVTDALHKGLNQLNEAGSTLVPAKKVGPGVWRIDVRNYGLGAADVAALDQADVLNIVDQTSQGKILESLVKDPHAFWLADDFVATALGNPKVYYQLTGVPATLSDYQRQQGVDFLNDLASLPTLPATGQARLSFVGATGQITLQKNRLMVRDSKGDSADGGEYYYQTFDVNAQPANVLINGVVTNTKNLNQNPLLQGVGDQTAAHGARAVYTPDASETIIQLPNGLQGYALWDAAGNRLDAADPAIVIDTLAASHGLSEVISVGLTCGECHNAGIIPLADKTRDHVTTNADQFLGSDVQLVQAVYHSAASNSAMFAKDSGAFNAALAGLGIKPGPDPVAAVGNAFLENWPVEKLAGDLGLTVDELKACINQSAKSKATIGELLTGATAPEADIAQALPQLILDCNLFQDPVAQ